MFKRILNYILGFFKALWEIIKKFNTFKGRISLILSIMIVVGWAVAFVVIGFISKDARMIGIGSAVIGFWATPGPQSPMWGLIIVLALIIQKIVLFDKKAPTWNEIREEFRPTWEETKAGINVLRKYYKARYIVINRSLMYVMSMFITIMVMSCLG